MGYRLRSKSAKQREYQSRKWADAMESFRSKRALHDELDALEREYSEAERKQAASAIKRAGQQ